MNGNSDFKLISGTGRHLETGLAGVAVRQRDAVKNATKKRVSPPISAKKTKFFKNFAFFIEKKLYFFSGQGILPSTAG